MTDMTFKTISGSIYEVDREAKLIRRVDERVPHPTSVRVGHGEWKAYQHLYVRWGLPATIIWPAGTKLLTGSPDDSTACTVTSAVEEIS